MPLDWTRYLPFSGGAPHGHEEVIVSVPDGNGRRWVEVPAADFVSNYGGGGGGGGGGAVKAIRKTFTLSELAAYIPASFPITGGNGGAATAIIAGDHRDVFPVGGEGAISGSAGADGYLFNITSSTFDGTHTTVVFSSTFGDISGGTLHNFGQVAGAEIYTPTSPGNEYVLSLLIGIPTGFIAEAGNVAVHMGVYSVADRFLEAALASDASDVDSVVGISDAVSHGTASSQTMTLFGIGAGTPATILHNDGITMTIDDGGTGADPVLTAGELSVTVVILTVTDE